MGLDCDSCLCSSHHGRIQFDWRDWARAVIGLPVEWGDFYIANAAVIILGIVAAELAPTLAVAPLAFATPMLINGIFFHIAHVIRTKGTSSPGVVTAVVLSLPIGVAEFIEASKEGVSLSVALAAFLIGAAFMAYPIVMLKLKSRPYFQQT
jgi:uncharacterized membrane protein HdeD (DUF308 family)